MLAPMLLVLLTVDPSSIEGDVPVQRAKVKDAFVATALSCENKEGLVFVQKTPLELHVVSRADGTDLRTVPLQALPPTPELDCGAGSCFFQQNLTQSAAPKPVAGEGAFQLTGQQSNYYGSWAPFISLREQGASAAGLRAVCPGERPLAICFTARRTVQVLVNGDRNDDPQHFSVDYVATSPGTEKHQTLHLTRGKTRKSGDDRVITFRNKGFSYALTVGPGAAALEVKQGSKGIQSEPCLSYAYWPRHLEWALGQ